MRKIIDLQDSVLFEKPRKDVSPKLPPAGLGPLPKIHSVDSLLLFNSMYVHTLPKPLTILS